MQLNLKFLSKFWNHLKNMTIYHLSYLFLWKFTFEKTFLFLIFIYSRAWTFQHLCKESCQGWQKNLQFKKMLLVKNMIYIIHIYTVLCLYTHWVYIPYNYSHIFRTCGELETIGWEFAIPNFVAMIVEYLYGMAWKLLLTTVMIHK